MSTAVTFIGCYGCEVSDTEIDNWDVGVRAIGSTDVKVADTKFKGSVALKGNRLKRVQVKNVEHIFAPTPTQLTMAIRKVIYGYD